MTGPSLTRRGAMIGGASAVAGLYARPGRAQSRMPLTVVLESEVVIVDPHATTAAITRSFGYQVFDTLFAMDSKARIRPQMVESWTTSPDGLRWDFVLRDALAWHDGTPVLASDCVASLRRWSRLDALGRMLAAATATMEADAGDRRRFAITLKEPFPLMLDILGKPNAPVPFMMPERILPPGDARIREVIGSGPFRFRADEWKTGDKMILERFADYRPRAEPSDFLAGGKVVKIDRMILRVMPDDGTGVTALMAGEIDYMQYLPFDWIAKLEKQRNVKVMALKGLDMFQGNFRLNHASGPFADPAIRQVLLKLVDQGEVLDAIGIDKRFRLESCPSYFMCDGPISTDAGSQSARFSPDEAKAALARTGYKGEPVVMLEVAGSISQTAGHVLAEHMKKAGFTVDEQTMDWGTVLARRAKADGWSLFPVYSNGIDMISPLTHFYIANNCSTYPGRSCSETTTGLLAAFARAADPEERRRIAAAIQEDAYRTVPNVMWGQFSRPAGYSTRLKNLPQSSFPMFWDVELAG